MNHRAHAILTVKRIDADQRIIEGVATTPTPDRLQDVVEPRGARFKLPLPLLLHHRHDEPVGNVVFAQATKDGIPFRAVIAKVAEPGKLKDRVDEAWQSVKAQLIRGVSIGFKALEHELMPSGGVRFKSWEWLELSLVVVPANVEATISTIKSIDAGIATVDDDESDTVRAQKFVKEAMADFRGSGERSNKLVRYTQGQADSVRAMFALLYLLIQKQDHKIKELRQSMPAMKYVGVWVPDADYRQGNFVTDHGALWHANTTTRSRPGTDSSWTLAVKKGKDARNDR
ncbi:MAG: hypothetical protein GEU95_00825 [Rhizobiales bacterium]|nr:hypothetical protein [Hyphomicrobiales bacterium]